MNPIYIQALSLSDRFGNSEDCIYAAADLARQLHVEGIDIEDRLLSSYEPNYLKELAYSITSRGVNFGYCGLRVDFQKPISSIACEINRAKTLIHSLQYLGIRSIRIPGNGVVNNHSFEETFEAVIDKFCVICQCAAQSGVTVYLHNHNHGATPSTGDQVLKMLKRINSPVLSYVLDTGQFQGSPGASGKGNSTKIADNQLYESIEICASKAEIVRAKFYFANDIEEQYSADSEKQ